MRIVRGMSSLVNLYEAPVATLEERFGFKRPVAVGSIAVVGCIVALVIQGIVSGWMDAVSIYICPLGAMLAAIMSSGLQEKTLRLMRLIREEIRISVHGLCHLESMF